MIPDAFDWLTGPAALDSLTRHPDFAATAAAAALARQPLGFVDVGARGGAHPLVRPLAGRVGVLAFEPDPEALQALEAEAGTGTPWARFRIEPTALAGTAGPVPLHLLAVPTNHSLLPPNPDFIRRYGMEKFERIGLCVVPATTLDAVLFDQPGAVERDDGLPWGEFLKLDTQGSEYEVLTGAERTLRERTVAVLCEVSFFETYRGQKLFSEVELFLRARGFSFFGFTHLARRSGRRLDKRVELGREREWWADAVFFKDPLPGGPPVTLTPRQTAMLTVMALLTGYFDYALELNDGDGQASERAALARLVHALAHQPPQRAVAAVHALAATVTDHPAEATVALGRVADERRGLFDYRDVPG